MAVPSPLRSEHANCVVRRVLSLQVDPFAREVPRYPFLVTAVRQTHLVCLSREVRPPILGKRRLGREVRAVQELPLRHSCVATAVPMLG